eukprot:8390050-Heterocapsa_arctica.AAC.1
MAVQKRKPKKFIVPGKFFSLTKCDCLSRKTRSSKNKTPRANGRGLAFIRTDRPNEPKGLPRLRRHGAIPSNN